LLWKGKQFVIYLSEIQLKRDLPPGTYLDELMVVRYLLEQGCLAFDRPVTFLVGENGAGKSTLLEGIAVACGFNPEGGTRNFLFSTQDTHSPLGQYLTPVRTGYFKDGFFLRAESFYNAASYVDELQKEDPSTLFSYGGTSLHKQSHGESFLALVQNRFGGDGLYILDEPEAALSPSRLLTLMGEIARLVEAHSQFIISTHSPILMAFPNARIYLLDEGGIRAVDYHETEHFCLTKRFLNDPEGMLHYLLDGIDADGLT